MSPTELSAGDQQEQEQRQTNVPSRQSSRSASQTKPKGILKNAPHHANSNNSNNNAAQYVVPLPEFMII
jgi:protein phosphatase inhibitor 2